MRTLSKLPIHSNSDEGQINRPVHSTQVNLPISAIRSDILPLISQQTVFKLTRICTMQEVAE